MSKIFSSIDRNEKSCLVCGEALSTAACYTAQYGGTDKVVSRSQDPFVKKVTTSTTTWTDVSKHIGAICVACGKKRYTTAKTRSIIMIVAGLGLFIISLAVSIVFTSEIVGLSGAMGQIVKALAGFAPVAGLILFLVGIVLAIRNRKWKGFKKKPAYLSEEEAISELIVNNLDRTKLQPGHAVFSMNSYKQLLDK